MPFDLVKFTSELLSELEYKSHKENTLIKFESEFQHLTVDSNDKRIQYALYNILSNAMKFAKGRQVRVQIKNR